MRERAIDAEQRLHQPNRDEWRTSSRTKPLVLGSLFVGRMRSKRQSRMLDAASTGDWIVTGDVDRTRTGQAPADAAAEQPLDLGPLRRPGGQTAQESARSPAASAALAGPGVDHARLNRASWRSGSARGRAGGPDRVGGTARCRDSRMPRLAMTTGLSGSRAVRPRPASAPRRRTAAPPPGRRPGRDARRRRAAGRAMAALKCRFGGRALPRLEQHVAEPQVRLRVARIVRRGSARAPLATPAPVSSPDVTCAMRRGELAPVLRIGAHGCRWRAGRPTCSRARAVAPRLRGSWARGRCQRRDGDAIHALAQRRRARAIRLRRGCASPPDRT